VAEWEDELTPDEVRVDVCLNRGLFRVYTEAKTRLELLREASAGMLEPADDLPDALQAVVEAKQAVDGASRTFVFATVDYDVWQQAIDEHPPTKEQRAENRYLDYNPLTFPAVAVRLSCVDPGLTEAQVDKLRRKLPREQWGRLWEAAWTANVGGSDIPKSEAAIVNQLASGLSSTMRPNTASPSPSSEDAA
jgi:hypothetical protein